MNTVREGGQGAASPRGWAWGGVAEEGGGGAAPAAGVRQACGMLRGEGTACAPGVIEAGHMHGRAGPFPL